MTASTTDTDASSRHASPATRDFVVVGGGVLGLRIARELRRRFSDGSVLVLEKEERCGEHASGRNSGVVHAGFYYSSDSLKARFTRDGNRRLTAYCLEHDLPIRQCGKLVVAREEGDLPQMDTLLRRARQNDVPLEEVTPEEARSVEPRVKTVERALWSPSTSSVDPGRVVEAFRRQAEGAGVEIWTGTAYEGLAGGEARRGGGSGGGSRGRKEESSPAGTGRGAHRVLTSRGPVEAGYVVNAAGLYADRVARDFGYSERYAILPFKGLYLRSAEPPGALGTHVYPVPDLDRPFLGVHFTLTVDGRVRIGPTATPAFWRENYRGLARFDAGELLEVLTREARLFLTDAFGFRGLAWEELRKHWRPYLVRRAARLARGVDLDDYRRWGRPGIRAQLLDLERRELVMDFLLEGDARSLHVLNAVSPGFTCALPFAEYVADEVAERVRR